MTELTALKRVAELRAGGTPAVDDPAMWDDDFGTEWIAIGDMTRSPIVQTGTRTVSELGMATKRLPLGRPGTVLFAMYASLGAVAVLGTEATWNQAILGIEGRDGIADNRFMAYWLEHLSRDLAALARSNTQDNLNAEQVGNLPFPGITVRQQQRIADFLDAETARIDALIEKKRSMINRLAERQSALADLKIRDAAASHIRLSLLLAVRISDGPHETPEFLDEGVPFLSVDNVVDGKLVFDGARRISSDAHHRYAMKCRPQRGDIIVTKAAAIGRVGLVETDVEFNIWSPLAVLRPDQSQIRPDFLYHAMRTTVVQDQIQLLASSNTQQNVAMSDLASLRVQVMSLTEQERIAATLTTSQRQVRELSGRLEDSVRLLQEHRQALITAAVTGQLDIAKAAA